MARLREVNPKQGMIGGFITFHKNIWRKRSLVSRMVSRDVRLQYRDSALGYFWSLLEPLLLSFIYVILYLIISEREIGPEYPLLVVIGVILWSFFSRSLTSSVTCLTGNSGMIKQVYFPREVFSVSTGCSQLVMNGLSLLVAVPYMIWLGLPPTWNILLVFPALILTLFFSLGLGLLFASANVVSRDIQHLFKFVTRAGMYVSPVLWTVDRSPESPLLYNPMATVMSLVRSAVTGTVQIQTRFIFSAVVITFILYFLGVSRFRLKEAEAVKKL